MFSSDPNDWFNYLNKLALPLVRGHQRSSVRRKTRLLERGRPVEIAILDTGFQLPKPASYAYDEQILGSRNWFTDNDQTEDREIMQVDLAGHGTYSTTLLMNVAPNAGVYVARVFGKESHHSSDIPSDKSIEYIVEVHIVFPYSLITKAKFKKGYSSCGKDMGRGYYQHVLRLQGPG